MRRPDPRHAIVVLGALVYGGAMSDVFKPLKNAFTRYATGVTVVTCVPPGGEPVGITVNSFTSVSLDPALVLWCLDDGASLFEAFSAAPAYGVSVLSLDQQDLSNRFATPGRHQVSPSEAETFDTGAPLLKGRLAGFDCTVWERHEAGDHLIMIGQVRHFDSRDGQPLIYSGRQYLSGPAIKD